MEQTKFELWIMLCLVKLFKKWDILISSNCGIVSLYAGKCKYPLDQFIEIEISWKIHKNVLSLCLVNLSKWRIYWKKTYIGWNSTCLRTLTTIFSIWVIWHAGFVNIIKTRIMTTIHISRYMLRGGRNSEWNSHLSGWANWNGRCLWMSSYGHVLKSNMDIWSSKSWMSMLNIACWL